MNTPGFLIISKPVYILILIYALAVSACSSGSTDSSSTPSNVSTVTASLDNKIKNVPLASGVPGEIKFGYTIPGDISASGDFSINLTGTLENISLSSSPVASINRFETLRLLAYALVKEAIAAETAQVTAHISYAGDPNVCSSPYQFGPYDITGMIDSSLSSDTESITPTQAAVDIINAGNFEVCLVTTPPIDAYLTITDVDLEFEPCADPSVDIIGNWSGTYECTNFGIDDDPQAEVNITITQNTDGSFRYIDDGGAVYNGHLCGNKYKFNGGLENTYTESGTMIVDGINATKTSNWLSVSDNTIGGRCQDNLQKI